MQLGQNASFELPSYSTAVAQDPENAELWAEVQKFKDKADEFYSLYTRLRDKRAAAMRDPKLQAEWNALIGEAAKVEVKISDTQKAINSAVTWVGGFFGIDNVQNSMRNGFGELGLWPYVIALVAGAVAWLTSWIGKGYILDRKLDSVESLVGQGYSPSQAASVVNAEQGTFLTELGGGLGKGLAFAGVAAMVLYFFFEKTRGF